MTTWVRFLTLTSTLLVAVQGAPTPVSWQSVAQKLMAPCCWSESVAVHRSEAAEEMRAGIRAMLAEGKSEREILDFYVAQYGERILMEPRGGKAVLVQTVPIAVAIAGACALTYALFRMRRRTEKPVYAGPLPGISDEEF